MWYPRTSGIWQTVWAERVGATYIDRIRWTGIRALGDWFEAFVAGEQHDGIQLKVKLSVGDQLLVNDVVLNGDSPAHSRPGIDDYRNGLLWSPEQPNLIDAEIQLWYRTGSSMK